jgi:hypothetical protein
VQQAALRIEEAAAVPLTFPAREARVLGEFCRMPDLRMSLIAGLACCILLSSLAACGRSNATTSADSTVLQLTLSIEPRIVSGDLTPVRITLVNRSTQDISIPDLTSVPTWAFEFIPVDAGNGISWGCYGRHEPGTKPQSMTLAPGQSDSVALLLPKAWGGWNTICHVAGQISARAAAAPPPGRYRVVARFIPSHADRQELLAIPGRGTATAPVEVELTPRAK